MSRLFSLFSSFFEKNIKKNFQKKNFHFLLGFCRLWGYFIENFWSRLCVSSWTWGSIFEKRSYDCLFRFFKISQKSCEKLKIEFLAKNTPKSAFLQISRFSPNRQKMSKSVQLLIFCAFPLFTNRAKSKSAFLIAFCQHFVKFGESQCVPSFFQLLKKYFQLLFSCFFQITIRANFFADFQTAFSWNISFDPKFVFFVCFWYFHVAIAQNWALFDHISFLNDVTSILYHMALPIVKAIFAQRPNFFEIL